MCISYIHCAAVASQGEPIISASRDEDQARSHCRVSPCNEASREINCPVVLFLTRFRFHGNDRPVRHDIISFIFVSCLRKPTGAEVFICFSHSSGRPPRTGASRSVVGTDIPVDSHPRPPPIPDLSSSLPPRPPDSFS